MCGTSWRRDEWDGRVGSVDFEEAATDFSQAYRAAVVTVVWNLIQHFFPYFDEIDVDWEAALPRTLERVLDCEDRDEFGIALDHLLARIDDGHARVSFGERYGGEGEWLPAALESLDGEVVVAATAEVCEELRVGDRIESIGGEPVERRSEEWRERASGSPPWKTRRALRELRSGPSDETVELTLRRDGASKTVEVERGDHPVLNQGRPEPIEEVDEGILYVDLTSVSEESLEGAVERLAGARGLVFDVRGYPLSMAERLLGHLADRPLRSVHHLVPRVLFPDRMIEAGWSHVGGRWWVEPETPRLDAPAACLIDERAISFAESIVSIVDAYDLATLVGSPTAGVNGNVNSYGFPDGNHFQFTGMKVVHHDGTQHFKRGIVPDVAVAPTVEGLRDGRDEVLERGIEFVKARIPSGVT